MTLALSVSGVGHSYGRFEALSDVSLDVPAGHFVALLGINGAGKSTLFSVITRLFRSTAGEITISGHDLRANPRQAMSERGVVFQSRALDMSLTVRQNIRYHAALHGIGSAEARRRGDAMLERLNLSELAQRKVATLSGGQLRRVEIVRALLHEPSLLLLDEPTVGLDIKARLDVQQTVRELAQNSGVGVLWATHLFDEVREDDNVVLLHQGKVIAGGTASMIAAKKTLSERFLELTGLDARDIVA